MESASDWCQNVHETSGWRELIMSTTPFSCSVVSRDLEVNFKISRKIFSLLFICVYIEHITNVFLHLSPPLFRWAPQEYLLDPFQPLIACEDRQVAALLPPVRIFMHWFNMVLMQPHKLQILAQHDHTSTNNQGNCITALSTHPD